MFKERKGGPMVKNMSANSGDTGGNKTKFRDQGLRLWCNYSGEVVKNTTKSHRKAQEKL